MNLYSATIKADNVTAYEGLFRVFIGATDHIEETVASPTTLASFLAGRAFPCATFSSDFGDGNFGVVIKSENQVWSDAANVRAYLINATYPAPGRDVPLSMAGLTDHGVLPTSLTGPASASAFSSGVAVGVALYR